MLLLSGKNDSIILYGVIVILFGITLQACSQSSGRVLHEADVAVGAERTKEYFPYLQNKRVGLVANQTSLIGKVHIKDTLDATGINLVRIFSPEHGFQGKKDAGEEWNGYIDETTGIPIVSLYGKHRKPKEKYITDLDVVVYDIQDVGVRFYTYISTMHYVMEACAKEGVTFLVLDRPNPNGFYVDGPVLDPHFRSFVGMHPVPVVYGMTAAEYARMINKEGWLKNDRTCPLRWVTCKNYTHSDYYQLSTFPSPNLSSMRAIYLYPSLALFEGTDISVGRGTSFPFEVFGHPQLGMGDFYFTPESIPGKALHPKHQGEKCRGVDLRNVSIDSLRQSHIQLKWLRKAYQHFPDSGDFFNGFFRKLSGNKRLKKQVIQHKEDSAIRKSWQKELKKFKNIRSHYLLYPDFD